jgi:transcriptional regulator with XRE-family HTH domain
MTGSMSFEEYIEMECRRDPEFARLWAEGQPRRDLAVNVWRIREARGWTQQQLAMRARLKQPRIAEIERGDGNPTLLTLTRIALALGVTAHRLLEETHPLRDSDTERAKSGEAAADSATPPAALASAPPSAAARKARSRARA